MSCFHCLSILYWNRFNGLWHNNQEIHPSDFVLFFFFSICFVTGDVTPPEQSI